jgi:hypothetical protein
MEIFTVLEKRNAAILNLALLHQQNQILVAQSTGEHSTVLKQLGSTETLFNMATQFEGYLMLDELKID